MTGRKLFTVSNADLQLPVRPDDGEGLTPLSRVRIGGVEVNINKVEIKTETVVGRPPATHSIITLSTALPAAAVDAAADGLLEIRRRPRGCFTTRRPAGIQCGLSQRRRITWWQGPAA